MSNNLELHDIYVGKNLLLPPKQAIRTQHRLVTELAKMSHRPGIVTQEPDLFVYIHYSIIIPYILSGFTWYRQPGTTIYSFHIHRERLPF